MTLAIWLPQPFLRIGAPESAWVAGRKVGLACCLPGALAAGFTLDFEAHGLVFGWFKVREVLGEGRRARLPLFRNSTPHSLAGYGIRVAQQARASCTSPTAGFSTGSLVCSFERRVPAR